jgi:hypothetical protein
MLLPYQKAYNEIFTEHGRATLDAIRDLAPSMGEFSSSDIISAVSSKCGACDCWKALNSLDHLVTLGLLLDLTAGQDVWGQHRRFRWVG